jgi:predicted phage terminase large subunit-like protein
LGGRSYQQRAQPPGGSKIQRDWFNIIDKPPEGLYWSRFWDLAVSVKTSADYTASIAGAIDSFGNIYLRDMIRGRWEWPDTRRLLINTAKHEKIPLGIEEAGVQAGFIQELLRDKKLQGTSIKGYRPEKDKLTRALAWISRAESGKLFLIKGPWINEFLNECQLFTGHGDKHDDQIDAVSGVYNMLNRVTTGSLYIPDPTEDNGLIFAGIMNEVF